MAVRTYAYQKYKARHIAKTAFTGAIDPEWEAARHEFLKFRTLVCGHDTYSHQLLWHSELNTGNDSRYLRGIAGDDLLILSPRGSSKSTFLIEWVAWVVGVHSSPENAIALKILYISYEKSTAQQKSQQIQRIVDSPEYRRVFPWVRPGGNWSKGLWEIDFAHANMARVSEPYTLACTGLSGTTTGKRSHLICLDDIIKSPESIENPQIREEMENAWNTVIQPTRFPGSRAVCLGTRMRPDDIYNKLFIPAQGWRNLEQSAITKDDSGNEQSYWEPKDDVSPGQPLEWLQRERERSPVTFSFQYQNVVVRLTEQSIDPAWIEYDYLPKSLEKMVLGVDLSAGLRETNDWTAMVLGGFTYERVDGKQLPRFYVIDAWRDRVMGNLDKLNAMLEFLEDWRHLHPFIEIHVETNAYQLSIAGDFETYVIGEKQRYDLAIVQQPSTKDKLARLRGITGLFQNRLVKFNHYGRNLGTLLLELTEFGSQEHDDLCDSLTLSLQGLRQRRPLDSYETNNTH